MNTKFTPIKPGPELLIAAYNQIRNHPETWNQEDWHCGSSHCFGGWCQVLAGEKEASWKEAGWEDIKELLMDCGLSEANAIRITKEYNTLVDIYDLLMAHLKGEDFQTIPPEINPKGYIE